MTSCFEAQGQTGHTSTRDTTHTPHTCVRRTPCSASRLPSPDRQRASAPAPPDPAGRSQVARPRPRPPPARSRPTAPRAAAGAGAASPPPPLAAARSCTQRAAEAPAVAADRSLSGRCRLRCSRPAEPGLLRAAARAWCRWSPRCCAGPPALQPGGQRSHRTTEDRGSRQSAAMRARLARPYRRRRAPVPPVSRGRPLGLLRQSALLARILGCRLCRRVP